MLSFFSHATNAAKTSLLPKPPNSISLPTASSSSPDSSTIPSAVRSARLASAIATNRSFPPPPPPPPSPPPPSSSSGFSSPSIISSLTVSAFIAFCNSGLNSNRDINRCISSGLSCIPSNCGLASSLCTSGILPNIRICASLPIRSFAIAVARAARPKSARPRKARARAPLLPLPPLLLSPPPLPLLLLLLLGGGIGPPPISRSTARLTSPAEAASADTAVARSKPMSTS